MEIEVVDLSKVVPSEYNPRVVLQEGDFEFEALKGSLRRHGMVVPLIINRRTGRLVSGHQRLNALREIGKTTAEAVIIDVPEEKEKALCIAMNKIDGEWDYAKLADIINELQEAGEDMDITGFDETEIDEILAELEDAMDEDHKSDYQSDGDEDSGVKCVVGEYEFRLSREEYRDLVKEIKEDAGKEKKYQLMEIERRLFGECEEDEAE